MNSRKIIYSIGIFLMIMYVFVLFQNGCGQISGGTSTAKTIIQARVTSIQSHSGLLGTVGRLALFGNIQDHQINNRYAVVVVTPEVFSIGVWRIRVSLGTLESSPSFTLETFSAFDQEPQDFILSSSSAVQIAALNYYPAAGEYDHLIPTIGYVELRLPAGKSDFFGSNRFRVITASYDAYSVGEVLVYNNDQWEWVASTESGLTLESSKPTTPYLTDWNEYFVTVEGRTVFEPKDVPFDSITIPVSPEGTYVFTLTFDVSNGFAFNDLNNNGIFEPNNVDPLGDFPSYADRMTSGEAEWKVIPPSLSVSIQH